MLLLSVPFLSMALSGQIAMETATDRGRGQFLVQRCRALDRVSKVPAEHKADSAGLEMANYCWGYIEGFLDNADLSKQPYCLSVFTMPQLAHEYVLYMDKHPKMLGNEASFTLVMSLKEAHPCGKR